MTMPDKVYAGHNGYGTYWQTNTSDRDTLYIRADIAEDLARALEAVDIAVNATYFGPDAEKNKRKAVKGAVRTGRKALARFRAITLD